MSVEGLIVTGKPAILERFQMFQDMPCHAVFAAGRAGPLFYRHKGTDVEESFKVFCQNLSAIEQQGSVGKYTVRFYEELQDGKKFTSQTDYSGSFTFRLKEYDPNESRLPAIGTMHQDNNFLQFLQMERTTNLAKIEQLEDTISELEQENDQLCKELEQVQAKGPQLTGVAGIIDTVGAVGAKYPWLQNIISDFATVAKHKVAKYVQPQQHQQQGGAMGNISTDTDPMQAIQQSLQKLTTYFVARAGNNEDQGFKDMAEVMMMLANLTNDPDLIELAIKKLKQIS